MGMVVAIVDAALRRPGSEFDTAMAHAARLTSVEIPTVANFMEFIGCSVAVRALGSCMAIALATEAPHGPLFVAISKTLNL